MKKKQQFMVATGMRMDGHEQDIFMCTRNFTHIKAFARAVYPLLVSVSAYQSLKKALDFVQVLEEDGYENVFQIYENEEAVEVDG